MPTIKHALLFAIAVVAIIYLNSGAIQPSTRLPFSSKDGPKSEIAELAEICRSRHSVLYRDVDSTEAYWDRVGGMTAEDLELTRFICERDGNCPILKLYNGQMYIRLPIGKELSYQSRGHSMLLMLSRVDFSYHANADFVLNTNDGPRIYEPCFLEMDKPVFEAESKSRNESINHFLFPDFTTYDWWEAQLPAFTDARLNLADSAGPFDEKVPKLFWRGSTALQQETQRTDLVNQLGPKTDVADVAVIHRKDFSAEGERNNFKSLAEMCQYQYIVYTEGITYSGRLKYTSLCNSIQIGHKITFIEFWTHILEPYYVNVKDWDDALRIYKDLQNNPKRAAALAKGASDAIREHLSPTGISCYIKHMMDAYARSIRWQVLSPEEDISGKNATGDVVDTFSWVPMEHFLAKMAWTGTQASSQNASKPINWSWATE